MIAEPIESFAGSLLANAKDVRTNASVFIEDIVNSTSNYISIYVNEKLADQVDEDDNIHIVDLDSKKVNQYKSENKCSIKNCNSNMDTFNSI